MEILAHGSLPPSGVNPKIFDKRSSSCALDHCFDLARCRALLSNSNPNRRWPRVPTMNHSVFNTLYYYPYSSAPASSRSSRVSPTRASNESYTDYLTGTQGGIRDLSSQGKESVSKIMIPRLPGESNGHHGSARVTSCFWEWKPKLTVHYEKSGSDNAHSPPLLFLPGFGVGSFHFEKQLKDLGRDYRVWALDFLGQGMSLPNEDPAPLHKGDDILEERYCGWGFGENAEPWAEELVYSADLWKDQVRYFIEQVIGEPVYIVGNSLGGYVALYFAASHPELVKGVTLLNATPFWGFLPNPAKSPLLARLFPWAGTFPLPANVRKLIAGVWEKISDPASIADVLRQVYADHTTNIEKVFARILETAEHPAAPAAFASIMFAPKGQLSFSESLSKCREYNIPICLMYGREDPWVTPVWGRQVKRQLPNAPYYEISPAGHCPHDEVPEVVNYLLRGWIKNLETQGRVTLPLFDEDSNYEDGQESTRRDVTKELEFDREGSKKLVRVRFFNSPYSLWKQLNSNVRARLQNLAVQPR